MPAERQEQYDRFKKHRFKKAHENLESNRRMVLTEGTIEVIPELDKDWAEVMLGILHYNQRDISIPHLSKIKRALEEGKFEWIGDPIRIDTDDNLIDGQHRLVAVAETGVSMYNVILVTVNKKDAIKYIDTTAKARTVNDIRQIHGKSKLPNTVMSAIMNEALDFDKSKIRALGRPEAFEISSNYDMIDEALELFRNGRTNKSPIRVWAGPLGAALRCMRKNYEEAQKFFEGAFSNHHYIDDEFVPQIQLLCSYFIAVQQDSRRGSTTGEKFVHESAEKSVRAWNAYREGRTISKLQSNGKIPKAKK